MLASLSAEAAVVYHATKGHGKRKVSVQRLATPTDTCRRLRNLSQARMLLCLRKKDARECEGGREGGREREREREKERERRRHEIDGETKTKEIERQSDTRETNPEDVQERHITCGRLRNLVQAHVLSRSVASCSWIHFLDFSC